MENKRTFALIANLMIVVFGTIGFVQTYMMIPNVFVYYTVCSNVLAVVGSVLYVLYILIKKNQKEIPAFVMYLRYAGTCCLALTFIVVITILSATGEGTYIENLIGMTAKPPFIFHHFLCPIISFVSFTLFEGDRRLNKKKTIWLAVIPTLVYGAILIILNLVGMVEGPYPFLKINSQPIYMSVIWFVVIVVLDYFLSRFTLLFNQMHASRR